MIPEEDIKNCKNWEKAEEILKDYNTTQFYNDGTHDVYTESAVLYMLNEMAKWKEQQIQSETSNYNPYKEIVKSILIMVEEYTKSGSDLRDFYNNVKVKCKDAIEYDKIFFEKQKTIGESLNISTSEECEKYHKAIDNCFNSKVVDNNTESEFKVGDWITNGVGNTCYIKGIFENYYELCSNDGFEYTKHIKDVDNYFQLWTIKDAKVGDVLYCKKRILDNSEIIMMYAGISNNIDSYCRYSSKSGFNTYITNVLNVEHDFVIPATKEQHDFLFQKMVEVGYKWDSNKKELIRIM